VLAAVLLLVSLAAVRFLAGRPAAARELGR
jgi:hypothetical protein